MLTSQVTAVSPTRCVSVSLAWKLMLPAQVTAVIQPALDVRHMHGN
jgi:hypothetical protein